MPWRPGRPRRNDDQRPGQQETATHHVLPKSSGTAASPSRPGPEKADLIVRDESHFSESSTTSVRVRDRIVTETAGHAAASASLRTLRVVTRSTDSPACPCGGYPIPGTAYAECCGPLHDHRAQAATAEHLMRSRYAAHAAAGAGLLDAGRAGDHLFRTWHPRTRPADTTVDPDLAWTGLVVTEAVAGGAGDDEGDVAFRAGWRAAHGRAGELVEHSTFARRAGRWVYVSAR